jgi:membrane protein required for colicin V production
VGMFYDLALLGILLIFIISGLRRGIVRSVIELVGFIAALICSVRLSGSFAALIGPYIVKIFPDFSSNPVLEKILAAAILFIALELLVHVIASVVDRVFQLPVLRQVNALLGGAFGLIKGVVVIFVICSLTRVVVPSGSDFKSEWQNIRDSRILQYIEEKNPVDALLQTDFWNEVNGNAKQKQKL